MSNLTGEELKAQVRAHWEDETCGTRYSTATDRMAHFSELARERYRLEPFIPSFAKFEAARGLSVLEIGVGAGADFARWMPHATHATGVDLTQAAIGLTGERLSLLEIPDSQYDLMVADAENLPFGDAEFDLVYSWGVLHHTPDTEQAIREVFRVLRPGGTARIMVYNVRSWTAWNLWLLYGLARGRPLMPVREAVFKHLESPGTKVYTPGEFDRVAAQIGFVDRQVSTKLGPGDLLDVVPSKKFQSRGFKVVWRLYPRPLVRLLGDRFGLYLMLEATKPSAQIK